VRHANPRRPSHRRPKNAAPRERRARDSDAAGEIGTRIAAALSLTAASPRPGNIAGMLAAKAFLGMVLRAAAMAALAGVIMWLLAPA
jgi:hypothetical protein